MSKLYASPRYGKRIRPRELRWHPLGDVAPGYCGEDVGSPAFKQNRSGLPLRSHQGIDPGRLGVEEVSYAALLIEARKQTVLNKELAGIQVLDTSCLLDELACKS